MLDTHILPKEVYLIKISENRSVLTTQRIMKITFVKRDYYGTINT